MAHPVTHLLLLVASVPLAAQDFPAPVAAVGHGPLSLAVGDLDGDGIDDLVIGAPGASGTRGAVYVFYGTASWPTTLDLGALPEMAASATGANPGDRLGVSLLLVDLDGDKKLEVLAGAPGASTVYALGTALARRARTDLLWEPSPSARGPAGSDFGRTLAGRGDTIAVGAPLGTEGTAVGIVYLMTRSQFSSRRLDASGSPRILGEGGGFGSTLALADLDESGGLWLTAAAPESGTGTAYLFSLAGLSGMKSVRDAQRTVRASAPVGRFGATLGSLRWPLGDALVVGAPSVLPATSPGEGSLFIVRSSTLEKKPALLLGADGKPAQAVLAGDRPGDALGSHLVIADFNQDGAEDVAVAAAGAKTVYVIPGPLL